MSAVLVMAAAGLVAVPDVAADLEPHGTWVDVGPMPNRRANPVAVRLEDGRVLVAGGETSSDGRCKSNADVHDPVTDSWRSVAGMHRDRCQAEGVLLASGKVLVVGGSGLVWKDEPGAHGWFTRYWKSAELYDPRRDRWALVARMTESRGAPIVEVLGRNRVLVTGGFGREPRMSSEIYQIRRDRWVKAPPMRVTRWSGSSVRLRGGDILVAGGAKNPSGLRTAERYSVTRREWRPAGHFSGTANPLLFRTRSGDVQAIPNSSRWSQREVHRFDPTANEWSRGSLLPVPRALTQVVSLRGNAFVLGGWGPGGNYTTRTALLWRPESSEWTRWTRIPQPVSSHAAVRLRDGSILVLGGQTVIGEGTHVPRKLAYRYYP
jgi:hypothetical protein